MAVAGHAWEKADDTWLLRVRVHHGEDGSSETCPFSTTAVARRRQNGHVVVIGLSAVVWLHVIVTSIINVTLEHRGVYPPRGHGAQDGRMGFPQFLTIMHLKCCADR